MTPLFQGEAANAFFIASGLLVIVLLVELSSRLFNLSQEVSRKAAHVSCGFGLVLLPWNLTTTWAPLLFALTFYSFMKLTKRAGLLSSVHGVKRQTSGASLYPVGVCGAFLIMQGNTPGFKTAILIMALADAAAGLVGQRFGKTQLSFSAEPRSLEGSLAFVLVAFWVTLIGLHFNIVGNDLGLGAKLVVAACAGIMLAFVEARSLAGSDNLYVPVFAAALFFGLSQWPRVGLSGLVLTAIFVAFWFKTQAQKSVNKTFK